MGIEESAGMKPVLRRTEGTMTALGVLLVVAAAAIGAAAPEAAQTPETVLRQAEDMARQSKPARAADLYRAFLKQYPDHSQVTDARWRLAKCLDEMGLVDEAALELVKVVQSKDRRYQHRPDAFYMLGKLYASAKDYEKATKVFEQALSEGGGLYEDEMLSLAGGYYALLGKHDEAAAKFNILRRRQDSRFAEPAAYKLALLWLKAENLELAVEAVEFLAARFPTNKEARGLMVEIADLFRRQRKFDQALAACEQVKARFPKSDEAQAAGYVQGLCYRDRKEYDKAIAAFDAVAQVPGNRRSGLAAEAILKSADIYFGDLVQHDKAMARYEETAKLARESASERRSLILEHCYLRLGEHYYAQKKWSVALEYYSLLRNLNPRVNILPRILKCQAELQIDLSASLRSEADLEYIQQLIRDKPGSFEAAEGEVFLVDRELSRALGRRGGALVALAEKYEAVVKKYPRDVLKQQGLESYIWSQVGVCYGQGMAKPELAQAIQAFERGLQVDPETPYKVFILENIARCADLAGDNQKAFQVYRQLYEMAAAEVEAGQADAATRESMSEYLRSVLTRASADEKGTIEGAIAVARGIMDKKGPFSDAARYAMFYIGELYYLKKDFSNAAGTYKQFIKAFGPPQDANGDVVDAPWKPRTVDDKVQQVFEAAVRIAHAWYMQGHTQNMLKAYDWVLRNFSYGNKYVAEAEYWMAMEWVKGRKGQEKENKLKMADLMWTKVVHPSYDFDSRDFRKGFHPWIQDPEMQKYVKAAILKAGQGFSEGGNHERAAAIFRTYLELYPDPTLSRRGGAEARPDPLYSIARYALGREYVALQDITKLIECYRLYVDQFREDRFRISGLMLLGYHAAQQGVTEAAVEAYATILDEYGQNERNEKGEVIALPHAQRVRHGSYRWNGIRMDPPPGLDLGEVRYALGYHFWRIEDWANCVKILSAFVEEPQLYQNKVRPKALYMVAQSYYHAYDYEKGLGVILKLLHDYPRFEAIDEAYVYAARGCVETRRWDALAKIYDRFLRDYQRSSHRPHMDLYAAVAFLGQGNRDEGAARLKSIARSETYEDVKADAYYYLGADLLERKFPDYKGALENLERSIALYPRERSCLAAAKCYVELKRWDKAKELLDRTIRDFPSGNRRLVDEARRMLPDVLKAMAQSSS
jgi:tetratricopeptide (TPR) repeat protein